jgi:hypothetical protein
MEEVALWLLARCHERAEEILPAPASVLSRTLLLVGPMCAECRCGSPVQKRARQFDEP